MYFDAGTTTKISQTKSHFYLRMQIKDKRLAKKNHTAEKKNRKTFFHLDLKLKSEFKLIQHQKRPALQNFEQHIVLKRARERIPSQMD